jgi:hypothetical protein
VVTEVDRSELGFEAGALTGKDPSRVKLPTLEFAKSSCYKGRI